eukprot:Trichotokara_eunicae@DN2912_c0_g1_i2.p2
MAEKINRENSSAESEDKNRGEEIYDPLNLGHLQGATLHEDGSVTVFCPIDPMTQQAMLPPELLFPVGATQAPPAHFGNGQLAHNPQVLPHQYIPPPIRMQMNGMGVQNSVPGYKYEGATFAPLEEQPWYQMFGRPQ